MKRQTDRILVAEDSIILLNTIVMTLNNFGYQVKTAMNGQQAVDHFFTNPVDLILMDADMPVLNGIEACRQIKASPEGKNVAIVMVTSYGERDWVDKAYDAGVTDYVMKPINWDVLRNRIEYILSAKRAESALFDEKEKAQITLESIGDGVITTNADKIVEYINPVASLLTGWENRRAQGKALNDVFKIIDEESKQTIDIVCPEDLETQQQTKLILLTHSQTKQQFAIEQSASPIRDRENNIVGMVLVFHDVTESRRMAQDIAYQASHDALTRLYNRREFEKQLTLLTKDVQHHQKSHVLLYMDLDRFKAVNDTCSHKAGDVLLRQVSNLLKKYTRNADIVARLGGDEFGFLLKNCDVEDGLKIANKLCTQIADIRFSWESHVFTIGASIGLIAITKQHANQDKILGMADSACALAKNSGRNQVCVYQEEYKPNKQDIQWPMRLLESLEKDGFCLFKQAIVKLGDDPELANPTDYHAYELLVRMRGEHGELILPGAFMSSAERYDLLPQLDRWILNHFLNWFSQQPNEQQDQLDMVSINLSNSTLADKNFAEYVQQQLYKHGISGKKICFEITELGLSSQLEGVQYLLKELKPLGCRFALDQFGTGSAVFSLLKELPVDFLKIQGQLIKGMVDNPVDKTIVTAIHQIGCSLGMETVAEYVEQKQPFLTYLHEIGVQYAQGYAFSEPVPLEQDLPI